MATTVLIDDQLMEEAHSVGEDKSSVEIVVEALQEYIKYRKQRQIVDLFGTIDYDETYDYKKQRQQR